MGLAAGCGHAFIEGTTIRDTDANREIYELVSRVREALERRDSETLVGMVSTQYFEDNGTPDARDDYGYVELKEKLLQDSLNSTKEMYLTFTLHDVVVKENYAYADIRYNSRARIDLPAGRVWDTHQDFNRLEFRRENNVWRIISGL